jgi:peptidoglycan/LPS O-acetylase OafA/YrhL
MHAPVKTVETRGSYYPAFDYLRIILASVVAAGHAGLSPWSESGNYSVQVFFAMSGWLIGGILLKSEVVDLPKFYFHRAARIWIPYFVAIGLLMAASLLKDRVTPKWIEIFFYDITFVYNFFGPPQLAAHAHEMPLDATGNHFWSICAEEQFYLLAPFLITVIPFGRRIWFWFAVTAFTFASPWSDYFTAISLGVTAAVSITIWPAWHIKYRATVVVFAVAFFLCTVAATLPYWIAAPLSAICIVLALAQTGRFSRIGAFLGGTSFPLYLNQWIGVFVVNATIKHFGWQAGFAFGVASLLLNFVIAAVLFLTIDRTVKIYRDQFFTKPRGVALAMTGLSLVAIGVIASQVFWSLP